jgi:hypothetical protein
MEDIEVVTSDDHNLGSVIAEPDDCVVVELGHVFKTKHAIPRSFLHEHDGILRATVTRDVVSDSPKIDLDNWDVHEVMRHYGVETTFVVDPDPEGMESAETDAMRAGTSPTPAKRARQRKGEEDPSYVRPTVYERQANPLDPTGGTANLDDKKHD